MASKKTDFAAGVNTGRVFTALRQATSTKGQQGTVSPAEAQERAEQLRTQGRKGCKAVRINMAFTPSNHEFIKVLSTITGQTMTEFTNQVIAQYREEHPEIFDQAKAIIDQVRGTSTKEIIIHRTGAKDTGDIQ